MTSARMILGQRRAAGFLFEDPRMLPRLPPSSRRVFRYTSLSEVRMAKPRGVESRHSRLTDM